MQKEISPVQSLGVIGVVIAICILGISYIMETHDKVMITNSIKSLDQIKITAEGLLENKSGTYTEKLCYDIEIAKFLKNAARALDYDPVKSITVHAQEVDAPALVAQDEQITCSQSFDNQKYIITADVDLDSSSVSVYCFDSNNEFKYYDPLKDADKILQSQKLFSCI